MLQWKLKCLTTPSLVRRLNDWNSYLCHVSTLCYPYYGKSFVIWTYKLNLNIHNPCDSSFSTLGITHQKCLSLSTNDSLEMEANHPYMLCDYYSSTTKWKENKMQFILCNSLYIRVKPGKLNLQGQKWGGFLWGREESSFGARVGGGGDEVLRFCSDLFVLGWWLGTGFSL